jgi:hypothetical protein
LVSASPGNRPEAELLESIALKGRVEKGIIQKVHEKFLFIHPKAKLQGLAVTNLTDLDLQNVGFRTKENRGKGIDALEITKGEIDRQFILHFIQIKAGTSDITVSSDNGRNAEKICGNLNNQNIHSIVFKYRKAFENKFTRFKFVVRCSLWTSAHVTYKAKKMFLAQHVQINSLQRIWPSNVIKVATECNLKHLLPSQSNWQYSDPIEEFKNTVEELDEASSSSSKASSSEDESSDSSELDSDSSSEEESSDSNELESDSSSEEKCLVQEHSDAGPNKSNEREELDNEDKLAKTVKELKASMRDKLKQRRFKILGGKNKGYYGHITRFNGSNNYVKLTDGREATISANIKILLV